LLITEEWTYANPLLESCVLWLCNGRDFLSLTSSRDEVDVDACIAS
jgi:hypothetical protein